MKYLLPLVLCVSCAATVEDVGRFLFPNRVVVERAFGDINGDAGHEHEREDWVVGLEWDLMPTEVRIVRDERPRSWFEPAMILDPEDPEGLTKWLYATVLIPLLGGGEFLRRRRRRRNNEET